MSELKLAIESYTKRKEEIKLKGKNLSLDELSDIQKSMDITLPNWYIEMMLNGFLINTEFEYKEYDDDDYRSDIKISDYKTILSEINEAYPGIEIKSMGYINFGVCLQGSGDQIFINLLENNNPQVLRIYHNCYIIDNGKVSKEGMNILANSLSNFFNRAEF